MTLEQRIQRLEDIEAIKYLMGTYFRCLDCKQWEELKECFAEDVKTAYSDGKLSFGNRDETIDFFRKNMPPTQLTMHQGHTPEIDITSDTTAKAYMYLHDVLVVTDYDTGLTGGAIYTIEYKKINDKWVISFIGYNRTYEETWPRKNPEKRKITANMFAKKD
ncbi:nuclear transport factor 2 family protein [Phosphitispora sp. TUW77]|uniref:nuclear transport factor 2 family protein n=1 Tax=Phosphitispora sp. TUW77 TaxID=3152361 RepID=UPI003AB2234A